MLSIDEIRGKVDAMEALAARVGEASAPAYRDLATQWRLLEVEAVFMSAISPPSPPRA